MELVYFTGFVFIVTFVYSLGKIFAQSDNAAASIWAATHKHKD